MRPTINGKVLWAAALAAALACAGGQRPHGAEGGAPWRELVSEHFVLRTDVSSDSARRLIAELELDRALLVAAMPALAAAPGRIEADALTSREEYWEVTGQRQDYYGHAQLDEAGRRRLVLFVSPSGDARDQARTVAHELAHVLCWHVIPDEPRWLAEGLAKYLESVAVEQSGGRWLGIRSSWYWEVDPIPVRELLGWSQEGKNRETRFYQSAWALVRYLDAEQPAGLAELERRLTAGEGAVAAWNGAFPRWSLATPEATSDLDRILRVHARDRAGTRSVSARVSVAPSERLLVPAEELTVRLQLRIRWTQATVEPVVARALVIDPAHVLALGVRASESKDPAARLWLARKAVAGHPEDARAWAILAWALPEGRSAEREAALRKAVAIAPEDPELLNLLALEVRLERPEEAAELASRAAELAPWSAWIRSGRATVLADLDRCEEAAAEARFVRARARRDGEDKSAWSERLGQRCGAPKARAGVLARDAGDAIAQGRLEAALRLADAALASDPENAVAWNERGRALAVSHRLPEAERAYRRAVELDPRQPYAWRNLGGALEHQGKGAEAIEAFRRQTEVTPKQPQAWRELGLVLEREKRPGEAIAPLERAIELAPKDATALLALGRVQVAAGTPKRAIESFERALVLAPDPWSLNEAAYALGDAGVELARAAAWAEKAVAGYAAQLAAAREGRSLVGEAELSRRTLGAWDTLGWIRFRQGRLDEAERWVAAAERLRRSAVVSAHLGEILEHAGRRGEAIDAYARAVAQDPTSAARVRLEALAPPPRRMRSRGPPPSSRVGGRWPRPARPRSTPARAWSSCWRATARALGPRPGRRCLR
jgi:tetratricopeptide (TPR) repeat protein